MGNRLWICFIVLSILVVCPRNVYAGTASNATFDNLEEAILYAVASTQSNYFVPAPVQTTTNPLINELIVLLGHGPDVPTPEDVVAAVNLNNALPGGIDVGNPTRARFGITNRAKGVLLEKIRANPDSPMIMGVILQMQTNPPRARDTVRMSQGLSQLLPITAKGLLALAGTAV